MDGRNELATYKSTVVPHNCDCPCGSPPPPFPFLRTILTPTTPTHITIHNHFYIYIYIITYIKTISCSRVSCVDESGAHRENITKARIYYTHTLFLSLQIPDTAQKHSRKLLQAMSVTIRKHLKVFFFFF